MAAKDFEARLQTVEDTLAIDRLEKIYGYYLCNRDTNNIMDLFSENTESSKARQALKDTFSKAWEKPASRDCPRAACVFICSTRASSL
jgi:hypothetical protein